MVELGPPRGEMKEVYKDELREENPELTDADVEKLAEERRYYTGGDSQ